jgi:hypothetical protein
LVARRWLCVESRRTWGRDAVETGFAAPVAAWLAGLDAKVFAIRRPRARPQVTVFAATTSVAGSTLRRLELDDLGALPTLDPWAEGEPVSEPLLLVCAHGRRDACCSRLGIPVFHALEAFAGPELVWQCSHTGGHRFAANVVGLPHGVTLGRVSPHEAAEIVPLLREGRVPLRHYRGRSLHEPAEQAAEVALRRALGLDRLDALRLVERVGDVCAFETDGGSSHRLRVEEAPGPPLAKSCGADPEPTTIYTVTDG